MIDFTFDAETGLARLAATAVIKAGADIPLRVTFSSAPGTATGLQFALLTDAAPPAVLAFTDAFATVSGTVATATLPANDTRLLAFLAGKATATVNAEFAATLDGVRQIAPNLPVTVQPPGVTGPAASAGGPAYYTLAQTNAAIAAALAGSGGLPEAPANGAAYGRQNGAWVKVEPYLAVFATGATDISTWSITGGAFTLHGDGQVSIDTPETVASISIEDPGFSGTVDASICPALISLDLGHCAITAPPMLTGLSGLHELYLNLTSIATPPDLTGVTNLHLLDLGYTTLTSPPVLTGLTALASLILQGSGITSVPDLTGLIALTALDMGGTSCADTAEIDALYNQLNTNASVTPRTSGYVDTSGGGNAAPTSASATARTHLASALTWTVSTN